MQESFMPGKPLPFTKNQIEKIIKKYPTPFHLYDEKAIRENARAFKNAFAWNEGFKEFFAVKAAPNPYLHDVAPVLCVRSDKELERARALLAADGGAELNLHPILF